MMERAMKKYFSLFCATVALLLSACNKQENDIVTPSTRTIRFVAESIETKTAFGTPESGKYPTLWTANDTLVKVACNYSGDKNSKVTPSSDFKTATFDASLNLPEAGPYTFMSLSPASASVSLSKDYKSWNVEIPTAQTPLTGSVDEDAQILLAVSNAYSELPETVTFQFKHMTAYGHFAIKNLSLNGAKVQSISVTSSVPFAGRWYYYLEDATVEPTSSPSSTITLSTTSVNDIWFACAPADLSGATLKISVATDKGTLEKTVTCPASAKLASGDVFKFAVDFTGITIQDPQKYLLVTNSSDLTPGSEVIIANIGDKMAISTTQNPNNRGLASVTIVDNRITDPADDVQLFVLEEGTVNGSVAFKSKNGAQAGKYLYAASSSSNYLRSQDDIDGNASWSVSINAEGIATIVAQGSNTRNHMRYNAGNSMVSAYAESSSVTGTLSIFKLEGSGGPVTQKTLQSIAVTNQTTTFYVGDTFSFDGKVTATYTDGSTKDVTSSATVSSPDMSTAGTKEVTVSYTENSVTKTAKYNITVNAAAGTSTVAQVLAGGAGTYSLANVLVYAVNGSNAIVGDSTGKMLLYKSGHGFVAGDIFSVTNVTVTEYSGVLELTSGTYTKVSSGNTVNHGTPVNLDDASAAAAVMQTFSGEGFFSAVYVSITGTQSGRYIENDNAKLYMNVANAEHDGHEVVAKGYIYSYSSKYSNYNFHLCSIEPSEGDKTLTVSVPSLTWDAGETGSKTFTVTTTNPASNGFTVSPASLEYFSYSVSGNVVTVSLKGNVTANKSETLTLTHSGNAQVTATVTLTRKVAGAVTDVLNQTFTGVTGTSYTNFSGKTGSSGAVYAGQCAGGKESIQLRSNNNNSGIVTTTSGGKVKKVVVTWNDSEGATATGRTLNVYGKSTAYSAATDLYSNSTQGTLLGTIVCGTSTELTVSGDYEYLGLRSASGAMYLTEVDITWE